MRDPKYGVPELVSAVSPLGDTIDGSRQVKRRKGTGKTHNSLVRVVKVDDRVLRVAKSHLRPGEVMQIVGPDCVRLVPKH